MLLYSTVLETRDIAEDDFISSSSAAVRRIRIRKTSSAT